MRLNSIPLSPRLYRVAKLIGWNALLILAGLALIGIAGEGWLRLTKPHMEQSYSNVFVPGMGYMYAPNTAVNWTNYLDFWVTERTNRLGFLDREPVSLERAASSCHISIIGDSFVDARQVPVADKFQVRLTQLAAQRLPDLDITASAYGRGGSGQFGQLPLYDKFASRLNPKLIVLVFVLNDLENNSPLLDLVYYGVVPGRHRHLAADLGPDGALQWHLPDPDFLDYASPARPNPLLTRALYRAGRVSWFAQWLGAKYRLWHKEYLQDIVVERRRRLELYRQHYDDAGVLDGWQPETAALSKLRVLRDQLAAANPPPPYQQAVTLTDLALGEFQARATRDGTALVILSEVGVGGHDRDRFILLSRLAAAHSIPVINMHDYIRRQGGDIAAADLPYDGHWNPQGHQWAAEALLEWLEQNREVCEMGTSP